MLSNDASLFNLIANSDENAFAEIYEKYTPSIRSHVKRIVRDPLPVCDIAQEVFVKLWVKRLQLTGVEKPSAWLYRMAANLSVTYLRHQRVASGAVREIETRAIYIVPETGVEIQELRRLVQTAISRLPEKGRVVYQLHSEEQLTYRQIADRLGISESTARSHVPQSKSFLREYLLKHAKVALPLVLLFPV